MPEITTIFSAFAALLVVLGGAGKYMLHRSDTAQKAALAAETAAREALMTHLQKQITDLHDELQQQRREKVIYVRRIYDLEEVITANKLPLPKTHEWPPT